MYNAFRYVHNRGASQMVMMGADSPTLPVNDIEKAFTCLLENDVVLGPSCDGGYYLI